MAVINIQKNVTSTGLTIGSGSSAYVLSGGKAVGFGIANSGYIMVSRGGSATGTVVSAGGTMWINDGGIITATTMSRGAIVNGFVIPDLVTLETGFHISGTTLTNTGSAFLYNGQTGSKLTMKSGAVLNISNGGSVDNLMVSSGALLNVFDGGNVTSLSLVTGAIVNGFTLLGSGNFDAFNVVNAGVGSSVIANLYNSQTIESAAISAGASAQISSGAVLSSAVNAGTIAISNGGLGSEIINTGKLNVSVGGLVDSAVISAGIFQIQDNGSAMNTLLTGGAMNVSSATFSGTKISGGVLTVSFGGKGSGVSMGGGSAVLSGGSLVDLKISKGTVKIQNNGQVSDAVISGSGRINANSGGIHTARVENGGTIILAGGGFTSAAGITILSSGTVSAQQKNNFTSTTVSSGGILNGFIAQETNFIPGELIHSNAIVNGTASLFDGEMASKTIVNSGGQVLINGFENGSVSEFTISSGGTMAVGIAGAVTLKGKTNIEAGGSLVLSRGHLVEYAEKYDTKIPDNNAVLTNRYYSAERNRYSVVVTSSIPPQTSGGTPTIVSSSIDPYHLPETQLAEGWAIEGEIIPGDIGGGQGKLRFDFSEDGGTAGLKANEAMLNDYTRVTIVDENLPADDGMTTVENMNEFVLTDSLVYADYILAGGALKSWYNNYQKSTLAIVDANGTSVLGKNAHEEVKVMSFGDYPIISANGTGSYSSYKFILWAAEDTNLVLEVCNGDTSQNASIIVQDHSTEWTNQDVTLLARFSKNTKTTLFTPFGVIFYKQYSIDGGDWQDYYAPSGVTITDNCTVTFKAIGANGTTVTEDVVVDWIDKIAPTLTLEWDPAPTSDSVKITVKACGDEGGSQLKSIEYSYDNKKWETYDYKVNDGVYAVNNGDVYFRATDHANNVYSVYAPIDNIYNFDPAAPVVTEVTPTTPTNDSISFSITYESEKYTNQWLYLRNGIELDDSMEWNIYGGSITIDVYAEDENGPILDENGNPLANNGTLYLRSINPVGVKSVTTTYEITNFDITAPDAPSYTITPEKLCDSVNLTVTFSEDDSIKEYSEDGTSYSKITADQLNDKSWTIQNITANQSYWFRETDLAGNVSEVAVADITNIAMSKEAPTVSLDTENWTSGDVTVTIKEAVGGGTTLIYQYLLTDAELDDTDLSVAQWNDAGTWNDVPAKTFVVTADTFGYVRGVLKDAEGNAVRSTYVGSFSVGNIDRKAPTITGFSLDPAGWTNADSIAVTIAAEDDPTSPDMPLPDASGVALVRWSPDGVDNWTNIAPADDGTFVWNVEQNGTYYFQATDAAGNVSDITHTTISTIDREKPVIDSVAQNTTDYVSEVTLTITGHDPCDVYPASGINGYQYLNGEIWIAHEGDTFVAEQNGIYRFRVTDAAGNASDEFEYEVSNLDDHSPVINSVTQSTDDWTNGNVTLTINASDVGSGVDATSYEYSLNGETWTALADNTFTVEQNGTYWFHVSDNVGNVSDPFIHTVGNIDKIVPVINSVTQSTDDWTNGNVTLTINASDVGSGVDATSYEYSLNGETWTALADNTFTVEQNGTYWFHVSDNVGNISDPFIHAVGNIDKTAPQIIISSNPEMPSASSVTVTAEFIDEHLATSEYSLDGKEWKNYPEGGILFTSNGTVYFRAADQAGNTTMVDYQVIVDVGDMPVKIYSAGTVVSEGMQISGAVLTGSENDSMTIHSGGIADSTLVNAGGKQLIFSGGTAIGTEVNSGGQLYVSSGGTASSAELKGGQLYVSGGSAVGTEVFGGQLYVSDGGSAVGTEVNSGWQLVLSGGFAENSFIHSKGYLNVSSGGRAENVTLAGGKISLEEGAAVAGKLVFDLHETERRFNIPWFNDLSLNAGTPDYYITVSASQTAGDYALAGGADGFSGTFTLSTPAEEIGSLTVNGDALSVGNRSYSLKTASEKLILSVETVSEIYAQSDINGNGISDVMFQYTGGDCQIGFWMDGTNSWQGQGMSQPAEWELLGAYDMGKDGKADALMLGNITLNGDKGAYIGYYKDGDTTNWQNISYLNNEQDIQWEVAVGNLTGTAGANSIVWHAPELSALGIWSDGTDTWTSLADGFDLNWQMLGTGDFDGNGKDEVLFGYNGGFFTTDIDQNFTALGDWGTEWNVRAVGDFSGDGKDDIVLFHGESGTTVRFENGLSANWTNLGQLDAQDWFIVGAGDYNGDQKDDLLVRHYSTGMLGYYESGDMTKWVEMGRGVDMNWTVVA